MNTKKWNNEDVNDRKWNTKSIIHQKHRLNTKLLSWNLIPQIPRNQIAVDNTADNAQIGSENKQEEYLSSMLFWLQSTTFPLWTFWFDFNARVLKVELGNKYLYCKVEWDDEITLIMTMTISLREADGGNISEGLFDIPITYSAFCFTSHTSLRRSTCTSIWHWHHVVVWKMNIYFSHVFAISSQLTKHRARFWLFST